MLRICESRQRVKLLILFLVFQLSCMFEIISKKRFLKTYKGQFTRTMYICTCWYFDISVVNTTGRENYSLINTETLLIFLDSQNLVNRCTKVQNVPRALVPFSKFIIYLQSKYGKIRYKPKQYFLVVFAVLGN